MELSNEDAFRLNVMLANDLQAVRINESTMTVYGLSNQGESVIKLNPTCRDDKYLRRVRELLSSRVLGSPGGYPVYLKRWARMGQARNESLERLLLLGEPEAVVAVVHASGLTSDLAQRAWWSMPDAESARCMLTRDCVVEAPIGKELAEFLVEYLPFEEHPEAIMESIRLILQPGLVSDQVRKRIWKKAGTKNTYYIGFLETTSDHLPDPLPAHRQWESVCARLQGHVDAGNPYAVQLCRCLSAQGQTFLHITETVLRKPVNQEVVVRLLEAIRRYFSSIWLAEIRGADVHTLIVRVDAMCNSSATPVSPRHGQLLEVLRDSEDVSPMLSAMLVLAALSETLVTPIFSRTDAIGTVMRSKLVPVSGPILETIAGLTDG